MTTRDFSHTQYLTRPRPQMEREGNCEWTDERRTSTGDWPGFTPSSKVVHQCPHCVYSTTLLHNLKRHILKHTGEKPFACTYCSYTTTRKELLSEHVNLHTGERPFACPYCTYSSSHKNILRRHIRIHTGEKRYSCTQCPFQTDSKSILNNHYKKHDNLGTV